MVIPDERNPVNQHYLVYDDNRNLVGQFDPISRRIVLSENFNHYGNLFKVGRINNGIYDVEQRNNMGERVGLDTRFTNYRIILPIDENPEYLHFAVLDNDINVIGYYVPSSKSIREQFDGRLDIILSNHPSGYSDLSSSGSDSSDSSGTPQPLMRRTQSERSIPTVSSRQTRRSNRSNRSNRSRIARRSRRSNSSISSISQVGSPVEIEEAEWPPNFITCLKCAEYQMPFNSEDLQNFPVPTELNNPITTSLTEGDIYLIKSDEDGRVFVGKYVDMLSQNVARFMGFYEVGSKTHFDHEASVNLTTHKIYKCPDGLYALYTLYIGGPTNIQLQTCAICLAKLVDKNALGSTIVNANEIWNVHPRGQGHYFHKGCIKMHCNSGRNPRCPICRGNIRCPA
jgi:hypothetical protein